MRPYAIGGAWLIVRSAEAPGLGAVELVSILLFEQLQRAQRFIDRELFVDAGQRFGELALDLCVTGTVRVAGRLGIGGG